MKIVDVTLTLFTWDGIPAVAYAPDIRIAAGDSALGLLAIVTDEGITGHAFFGGANRGAQIEGRGLIDAFKPQLLGQDPLDRERLYQSLRRRGRLSMVRAIGAVDVALWDLAGKAANLPIHQLLGTYRHSIPAYASSQMFAGADEYCRQALHYKSLGWRAYRIHPPHPWQEDIKVCAAVRAAVGEEYPLMATELPFAGLDQYAPWILGQATDFLRGDVCFKGGITTCIKTAHLAEAFGMNYEIHHGSNSLNNVACLHLAMAIANTEFYEVLLPDAANKFGLIDDIEVDSDGLVHAPTAAGLGARLDFERIQRNTQAVLR
jgi:L-alanine-DL-glutamate epimerase-like enolase superfamily enzyme